MKKMKIRTTFTLLLCLSLLSGFAANGNPKLTIEVQNIEAIKGNIRIAFFNTSEKFLKEKHIFKRYVIAVNDTTETIIIDDLPKGEYAFMLFHDDNSDDKFNRSLIGVPKEKFAFSNNLKPKYAKPTFEEAKFLLTEDQVFNIKLRYY